MKPFVLRRLKSEVLRDLPIKTDEIIICPMSNKQKSMYEDLIKRFSDEARETIQLDGLSMMMQLRKLANHPLLLRNYYDESKLEVGINL